MPTMRDVAREAGVSPMTVSRVLNDPSQVHPETRERVVAAMARLNYTPHRVNFRRHQTVQHRVLALILADMTNPFFTQIARGVEGIARQYGYGLILHNTAEDPDREWETLLTVRETRVAGVLWAPCGDVSNVAARILLEAQIPTVLIDRLIPGVPSFDAVISDNRRGANLVTTRLLQSGCSSVTAVLGKNVTSVVRDRLLGVRDALEANHYLWDERMIVYCDPIEPISFEWSQLTGQREAPCAVFAWNQVAAASVYRAAVRAGRQVPRDLMIGTFDNPDPYALTPGYFVIAQQDPYRMGMVGAQELIQRIDNPEDETRKTIILPVTTEVGKEAIAMPASSSR
ncbi:MAG: LacI family DNA-binding transcriptional regulator [Firmicutes bacterium]|nr:LacI family DNA-binding transcriptional regulator [Bacillota bacterium]